jgi:SSS family solute:Na+ symporter
MLFSAIDSSIPLWIVGAYLLGVLSLGVFSSTLFKGTSKDYFVASRSIGSFVLLMSVFGTTMTGFALVGSTGKAFTTGVATFGAMTVWSGLVHSAVFFMVGLRLWAIGKRRGYVTQVQFFRDRFDSKTLGTVLFVLLVLLIIPYLLVGIISAGKFMEGTAGLSPKLTGAVICGVVLIYVFLGGVRSAAWANTLQTLVFMLTGIVAFILISKAVAEKTEEGAGGVLDNVKRATEFVELHKPERLVRGIHPEASERHEESVAKYEEYLTQKDTWDALVKDMGQETAQTVMEKPVEVDEPQLAPAMPKLVFITYLFIPLSIGMFPHIFQHWLTAKSAKTFRLAIVAHPICIAIVWLPCVLIGVWAAGLHSAAEVGALSDGLNQAFSGLSDPNEVLATMVRVLIDSPWLMGLLMAGVLAAIMSSLDSQFACLGTMFTNDIVVPLKGKDYYSDADIVKIARIFVVGVVVVAYLLSLALMETTSVFNLGMWCFSGFTALFPIVFAALYWKRATALGVYACIGVTVVLWVLWFSQSGYGADKEFTVLGMLPVAMLTFASTVALVAGSLLSRPPAERVVNRFFLSRPR